VRKCSNRRTLFERITNIETSFLEEGIKILESNYPGSKWNPVGFSKQPSWKKEADIEFCNRKSGILEPLQIEIYGFKWSIVS
jgi:hypothetical protein